MSEKHLSRGGTLSLLPTRLSWQSVIIGDLIADEVWITVFTCGAVGFALGIPAALAVGNTACIPLGMLLVGTLGLGVGSRVLWRMK